MKLRHSPSSCNRWNGSAGLHLRELDTPKSRLHCVRWLRQRHPLSEARARLVASHCFGNLEGR